MGISSGAPESVATPRLFPQDLLSRRAHPSGHLRSVCIGGIPVATLFLADSVLLPGRFESTQSRKLTLRYCLEFFVHALDLSRKQVSNTSCTGESIDSTKMNCCWSDQSTRSRAQYALIAFPLDRQGGTTSYSDFLLRFRLPNLNPSFAGFGSALTLVSPRIVCNS